MRLGAPSVAVATDEPAAVLVDLREARVVPERGEVPGEHRAGRRGEDAHLRRVDVHGPGDGLDLERRRVHRPAAQQGLRAARLDRKSTRLNSSHANISYAVFCLKKKKNTTYQLI